VATTAPSRSVTPSSLSTTSSNDEGTSDSNTQWAGFSAAMETLNS
jgi:hypothetical protein